MDKLARWTDNRTRGEVEQRDKLGNGTTATITLTRRRSDVELLDGTLQRVGLLEHQVRLELGEHVADEARHWQIEVGVEP